MLHLVFHLQPDNNVLDRVGDGDVIVFFNSGVLRVLHTGNLAATITAKLTRNRMYALAEDMLICGITPPELVHGLEVIDYSGLVQLTEENALITTWS